MHRNRKSPTCELGSTSRSELDGGASAPPSPLMHSQSPSRNVAERWSLPLRLLHWITVPLLFVQFAVSLTLMGDKGAVGWFGFHASLGACLVIAIGARLVCRLFDRGPSGPRLAARLLQAALYLVLVAVSATGWLAYRPSPFAVRSILFGRFDLPVLAAPRFVPWAMLHRWLVWLLLILVAGHVLMAIFRGLAPGDRTLEAMSLSARRGRTRP